MNKFEQISSDHHQMSLGILPDLSRGGRTLPDLSQGGGTLPRDLFHDVFDDII